MGCWSASGRSATVGAIVAASAARPTNFPTSFAAAKRYGTPIWRRTSSATATACKALPRAMSAEARNDAFYRDIGGEAADPDAGPKPRAGEEQRRGAMPEAGQMALA